MEVEANTAADVDSGSNNGAAKPKTLGDVLTRDRMLAHAKTARPLIPVPLPWIGEGAGVFVRGLGATGKDEFDDKVYGVEHGKLVVHAKGVRALLISICTVDAEGKRIFSEEDVPALAELDGRTADAIYTVASRESNLTQADVDHIVKNSEGVPSGEQS